MHLPRWALALPLVLAASITSTHASTIRDNAGLFSADAVRLAQTRLDKLEQDTHVPVTIETVDSLEGKPIGTVLPERARQNRAKGLYVLIAKQEHKIEVQSSREYAKALTKARNQEIRSAFIKELEKRDFNAALNRGIEATEQVLATAKAESGGAIRAAPPAAPAARGGAAPRARPGVPAAPGVGGGGFGLSSLLGIGLLVLVVLFGIRLLGSLFGGGNRGYAGGPQRMGGPGYGAPGYGGGGMGGGGGGGFMSSMFGGIGGALAGNWLYDQFSGRSHGGGVDQGSMGAGAEGGAIAGGDAGTEWGGGDGGADWGGDAGGGGDVGGGGDWGGGGGGGDWSGGGGGGDWGGGGGDGGGGGGDW